MFLRSWFPPALLETSSPMIAGVRAGLLATDPQGFAGSYAAVRDMEMRRTIKLISSPTLVIGGQYDTVTLPSHSDIYDGREAFLGNA
jgi:3-oxoadipate enol-lactonase